LRQPPAPQQEPVVYKWKCLRRRCDVEDTDFLGDRQVSVKEQSRRSLDHDFEYSLPYLLFMQHVTGCLIESRIVFDSNQQQQAFTGRPVHGGMV